MSEAQAERAITHLYEDEGLRSELPDPEAGVLLEWGEAQIVALSERGLRDEAFDALATHLQRLLAVIAQFIAKRDEMTPLVAQAALNEIGTQARILGYGVTDLESYVQAQSSLPPEDAVRALAFRLQPLSHLDDEN